jgi:hypothetical protein
VHLREHATFGAIRLQTSATARLAQQPHHESTVSTMKVRELIALLERVDPNAEVYLMCQPSWPFEYAVAGVAVRGDFKDEDDLPLNDVFILEGSQERYGSKEAWRARRR